MAERPAPLLWIVEDLLQSDARSAGPASAGSQLLGGRFEAALEHIVQGHVEDQRDRVRPAQRKADPAVGDPELAPDRLRLGLRQERARPR